MRDRRTRTLLGMLAVGMVATAVAFLADPPNPGRAPRDRMGLANWMAWHPADWIAATAISDAALDMPLHSRQALWRAAYEQARYLAPQRVNPRIGFVRAALFHWYELDPRQRRIVLQNVAPMLRDPKTFRELALPLLQLTRDFSFLRRNAPATEEAATGLRELAATNGLFPEYRALRAEVHARRLTELQARRATAPPPELIRLIPMPLDDDDRPLVQEILDELHRRPLDEDPLNPHIVDGLIDFVIRHHMQPLDGIDIFVREEHAASPANRARLALRLETPDKAREIELTAMPATGDEWTQYFSERAAYERAHGDAAAAIDAAKAAAAGAPAWRDLCGLEICTHARKRIETAGPAQGSLTLGLVAADDVLPYVEISVDSTRVAEGSVMGEETFAIPIPSAGLHLLQIELINPFTRNRERRRVRIVRESW
ncbi:MAG: hypothetical protein JWN02_1073 [Acidobacteria bacterium]|nr:hypothetical protein [Acidobacteriota bacterium]